MGPAQTHTHTKRVEERQQDTLRFAKLSDTHLGHNPDRLAQFERFDSHKRTETLLHAIAQEPKLDFLIHGGDIVDQGQIVNYVIFDRLVRDSLPDVPCYVVPGNHDKPSILRDSLSIGAVETQFQDKRRMSYVFVRGRHHFLMIDGVDAKQSSRAEVGMGSLEWLEAYICELPDGHTVWPICHFPMVQPTERVPKRMVLQDGAELRDIFLRHWGKIGFFAHGHLHIQAMYSQEDIPHLMQISAPSGSYALSAQKGGLGEEPHGVIGYEVFEIRSDGSWSVMTKAVDVSSSRLP